MEAAEEFSKQERDLIEKIIVEIGKKTAKKINQNPFFQALEEAIQNNDMIVANTTQLVSVMLPKELKSLLTGKFLKELERILTKERKWLRAEFQVLDGAGNAKSCFLLATLA